VQRADVICIPMRPSPMDFGVTTNTAELVKTLKRPDSKAFIVLNQLRKVLVQTLEKVGAGR